jgi:hypothetical protein
MSIVHAGCPCLCCCPLPCSISIFKLSFSWFKVFRELLVLSQKGYWRH